MLTNLSQKNMYKTKIILFLISYISFTISFGQTNLSSSDSIKYINHKSYNDLLQFLRDSTEKIDSEIERLSFIRKQIAEIIDIGAGGKDISLISDKWVDFDGKKYYDLFYNNIATIKCGGTSFFLKNVYTDLGYESAIYDMGCPGIYTHQVTIVKNKTDEEFYVQDAFHNVSYYNKSTKQYIPFRDMIKLLKEERAGKIKIVYETYNNKIDWDTTGLQRILITKGISPKAISIDRLFPKQNKKKFIKNSQRFIKRQRNCLRQNKLPEHGIYLFLFPLEHNLPEIIQMIKEI